MKRPPKDTAQSQRGIGRRTLVVGGLQLATAGLLALKLRSMQVEQAETFRLLADENRINIKLLPPARGLIYDRRGVLLAGNEQNYRITMTREDAGDVEEVLDRLSQLIPLSDTARAEALKEMSNRSAFVPVTIADRLTWDDITRVTVNAPALPGVTTEVGLSRYYSQGADLAHVIGYVGPVSDYDLSRIENPDPLLQIPKFQIGKTGVEAKMEEVLRGSAGTRQIEVNAIGRVMRELSREEGQPGADLQLTIDSALQTYVEARLEGESAGAVVIDLENGDLRAVVSSPSFDPNLFVRGISVAEWNALNENPFRPLAAKAVQGTYPPGSTFKMITALAALEDGVLDPEETILCRGYTEVSGTRFHCWKSGGHGNVNLHDSLKQSCDCYYYEVSQRVGIDKISAMARRFGLGVRHDLPLSAVAEGLAPDKEWKATVRGEDWRIGDTVNASIGQGYVLASPLQLAIMSARIATGRTITPRLIHTIDGVETPKLSDDTIGLNENYLRRIRAAMDAVSNNNRGTAYGSRINVSDKRMGGKTGTSQVRRITAEERARGVTSNADLPWERRDHALFVGFAPVDNPKYAVAVVVEHGGGGSAAAAPIARDVMLQALYEGQPPLEAYPSNVRGRISEQQRAIQNRVQPGAIQGNDRA
ncbi:penicillin-binding protein 2 [Marivivens sp. JLT3646]|uniref:penicillin-binding protein 2 n=1 Tax=Marivivens sp. JLT3646 TaxID=1920883 RepID=UPI000801BAE1|nr:penicillin-binding protein 2 [Marivivens sp. JLT3646]APO87519.1 penicillin-binding protein 2 [Marivivens sp. JLT3646]OBR36105.1 penicillin-binding protein 2 [Donghicola sp. JL3646]